MCLHRAIVYYVKKLTYIYIYVKGISAKLPLFDWLRNRRYKKGRDRQYRELEGAHGILLGPFWVNWEALHLITKRQQAWVTVPIKVVF